VSQQVTVELPDDIAARARQLAARTQRSVEEVVVEWARQATAEPALELLSDEELLAVCDAEPAPAEGEELAGLLEGNREGALAERERARLEEVMGAYRAGLVRKARALALAVRRGLRPRLS
jgi:hypothetical protein